jgi:hypothetical protein
MIDAVDMASGTKTGGRQKRILRKPGRLIGEGWVKSLYCLPDRTGANHWLER